MTKNHVFRPVYPLNEQNLIRFLHTSIVPAQRQPTGLDWGRSPHSTVATTRKKIRFLRLKSGPSASKWLLSIFSSPPAVWKFHGLSFRTIKKKSKKISRKIFHRFFGIKLVSGLLYWCLCINFILSIHSRPSVPRIRLVYSQIKERDAASRHPFGVTRLFWRWSYSIKQKPNNYYRYRTKA